jgi:hypothetical protein
MHAVLKKIRFCLLRHEPWLIMTLAGLLFLPSLNHEPLRYMDDWFYVFQNENLGLSLDQLRALVRQPVLGLWTPLPMLSYVVDYAIGGHAPWVYRLQNILWHLAATAAVWFLLRELGLRRGAAFFVTLIFAVHPQRVESVVWIAERKDVMTAFFFFAALTAFVRARKKGVFFDLPTLLFTFAAMYCKPSAVALPAVMFLLETHRARRWDFRVLLKLWPYLLAAALYLFSVPQLTRSLAANVTTEHAGSVVLLMMRNYFSFIGKTFLPLELNPVYPYFIETPVAVFALTALAVVAVLLLAFAFRKNPAQVRFDLLPFLLIFGGLLLPVSGLQIFSNADFADRYSYIPSVFLLIPAALLIGRATFVRRPAFPIILVFYVGCLAVFNLHYQRLWANDAVLFQAACDTENPNYRAAAILAWQYLDAGKYPEAAAAIERAGYGTLQQTNQRGQIENDTDLILGLSAYRQGDRETAHRRLTAAALSPYVNNASSISFEAARDLFASLGALELERNNPERAAYCYQFIETYCAEYPFFRHYYRGVAAMIRKDYGRAATEFEAAAAIVPGNPETEKNLKAARALLSAGRPEKAPDGTVKN